METLKENIVSVVAILVCLAALAIFPYYEAKSFNECTGGKASYATAIFTELRVENCKK